MRWGAVQNVQMFKKDSRMVVRMMESIFVFLSHYHDNPFHELPPITQAKGSKALPI